MGKDGAKKDDIETKFSRIEEMFQDLKSTFTQRTKEIEDQLKKVIDSQAFISKQYDKFSNVIDNIMKDNVQLRKENEQIQKRVDLIEKELKEARRETNDLEQYGRRSMVEISGVPQTPEENTENIVLQISKHMKLDITHEDIEASHRISTRENASIIVKFNNRKVRDNFYLRRISLKGRTTHDLHLAVERQASKVFINESLTRKNKELFSTALQYKKDNNFRYLWTRNGTIFIRKSDQYKPTRITFVEDLNKDPIPLGNSKQITNSSPSF